MKKGLMLIGFVVAIAGTFAVKSAVADGGGSKISCPSNQVEVCIDYDGECCASEKCVAWGMFGECVETVCDKWVPCKIHECWCEDKEDSKWKSSGVEKLFPKQQGVSKAKHK